MKDLWKQMSLFLLGILLTGTTFYIQDILSEKGYITRFEASQLILSNSPYLSDKKFITQKLVEIDKKIDKIESSIEIIKNNFYKINK